MITDSFDNHTEAKINPYFNENAVELDVCILTFSRVIEEYVLASYPCEKVGETRDAADTRTLYRFDYKGKKVGFFKTYVGAPACVGSIETAFSQIRTRRFVVFGGAGCLNKAIAHGKVMVPTEAYRDEGTSYHYAPASDYIPIKNHALVSAFMKANAIPYVEGKTWTTDAFYRETVGNFEKRKSEGCICVEMEGAAVQALCDFRSLDCYLFYTGGDLLDAPTWTERRREGQIEGTQHDATHFEIALELAVYVCEADQ